MYKYPYQNLSLVDMDGEIWKPLPDYEKYIMISNLGRIKLLPRTFVRIRNDKTQYIHKKECIKKQFCLTYRNQTLNETCSSLFFDFENKYENINLRLATARAVYMTFISKEEAKNTHNFIHNQDNDSLNNRIENLCCMTSSDYRKYVFESGRTSCPEIFKKNLEKRRAPVNREKERINQLISSGEYPYQNTDLTDLDGEIWKPLRGAESGFLISNMGRIKSKESDGTEKMALQQITTYYNYDFKKIVTHLVINSDSGIKLPTRQVDRLLYFSFIKPVRIEFEVLHKDNNPLNNRLENLYVAPSKIYYSNPVTQYDREGNRIAVFNTPRKAAEACGIDYNSISCAIKGTYSTAGGYLWKSGEGNEKIDISGLGVHPRKKRANASKKVARYDSDGNLIEVYPSLNDACIQNGCCIKTLKKCLKGVDKTKIKAHIGQYDWRYVD